MDTRKAKLQEKGLIVENDNNLYKRVLTLYKDGFNAILNEVVNFSNLSKAIEESKCFFAPSKTFKDYGYLSTTSPYFYFLNTFYLENLNENDIEILKNKTQLDEEVVQLVKRTLKDVIKKEKAKNITYFNATPETIIRNGTLVFAFVYGKNSKALNDEEYLNNIKAQKKFINLLKNNFENGISSSFNNVDCKLLSYKIL